MENQQISAPRDGLNAKFVAVAERLLSDAKAGLPGITDRDAAELLHDINGMYETIQWASSVIG